MTTRSYQAGQFTNLVTLEQLAEASQDALGAPSRAWTTFATWWTRVNPLTGSEAYSDRQIEASAQLKFEGNYIAGVTPKMRINDHGVFYDIVSPPLVFGDRAARYMTILAKLGVGNG